MVNHGKVTGCKTRKFNWCEFDSLPLHCKEVIWNSPFDVMIQAFPTRLVPVMQGKLAEILRKNCLATYGAEHPQSGTIFGFGEADFADD